MPASSFCAQTGLLAISVASTPRPIRPGLPEHAHYCDDLAEDFGVVSGNRLLVGRITGDQPGVAGLIALEHLGSGVRRGMSGESCGDDLTVLMSCCLRMTARSPAAMAASIIDAPNT